MKKDLKHILIETMFEALYFEGYNASNLNTLLKKAGTSKGGLYHHFGSKKELALETLSVVVGDFLDLYWKPALESNNHPVDAIEELLKKLPGTRILGHAVYDFKYGCPLNNMIQEMSAIDDDFNALLSRLFTRWATIVKESFDRAVEKGVFKKDMDTLKISEFFVASLEGCLSMAKVRRSEETYLSSTSTLLEYLRTYEA